MVRVVAKNYLLLLLVQEILVQKVEIPEPRPFEYYKVRVSCPFSIRGNDAVLLGAARRARLLICRSPRVPG